MKKTLLTVCVVVLSAPLVASAANTEASVGKNPRLLHSEGSGAPLQSDSIQEKITKLQKEIQKGSSVYTADELKLLAAKLDEYASLLDAILYLR